MYRGDTAGALTLVLSDYPYGPNVEEAKVSASSQAQLDPATSQSRTVNHPPASTTNTVSPLGLAPAQHLTLQSLLEIVNSTKSSDISQAVKSISIDQRDALMKYLYKGLELGGEGEGINCAVLLSWHERVSGSPREEWDGERRADDECISFICFAQLTEVAGTGCIVRVMADRRRV